MNQMQQMLMQANKIQRELTKAHEELEKKSFEAEKAGMVKVTVKGDKTIEKIEIDPEALDKDSKEMLEEAIAMAVNDAIERIKKEADAIDERITGKSGLPF